MFRLIASTLQMIFSSNMVYSLALPSMVNQNAEPTKSTQQRVRERVKKSLECKIAVMPDVTSNWIRTAKWHLGLRISYLSRGQFGENPTKLFIPHSYTNRIRDLAVTMLASEKKSREARVAYPSPI